MQTVQDMAGKQYPLAQYAGKVAVVVNVASQCGWTKRQVVYLLCRIACSMAKLVTISLTAQKPSTTSFCCCSNYEGLQFLWDKYRDYGFTVGAEHWLASCCACCHSAADS